MLNALSNVLGHASTIILVIPGSTEKLSESLQEMLNQMTLTFGKTWWDYVVIGVSFWHFDQESIEARITREILILQSFEILNFAWCQIMPIGSLISELFLFLL